MQASYPAAAAHHRAKYNTVQYSTSASKLPRRYSSRRRSTEKGGAFVCSDRILYQHIHVLPAAPIVTKPQSPIFLLDSRMKPVEPPLFPFHPGLGAVPSALLGPRSRREQPGTLVETSRRHARWNFQQMSWDHRCVKTWINSPRFTMLFYLVILLLWYGGRQPS